MTNENIDVAGPGTLINKEFAELIRKQQEQGIKDIERISSYNSEDILMNLADMFRYNIDEVVENINTGRLNGFRVSQALAPLRKTLSESGYETTLTCFIPYEARFTTCFEEENLYQLKITKKSNKKSLIDRLLDR